MNESARSTRLSKAICKHFQFDDDTTNEYSKIALECAEYMESEALDDTIMVAQLVTESEGNSLLSAMLNYGKLLMYGTQIPMPSKLKIQYYSLLISHVILMTAAFYKQGYDDAVNMESPEAFDDFISGLGLDDSSK